MKRKCMWAWGLLSCGAAALAAPAAHGGGCVRSISSSDGAWTACVDQFGQVVDLFPKDQPTVDNLFETLVYEASSHNGQLSRRVEQAYVVTAQANDPDHTFTRLEKAGFPLSIEIENFMIPNPNGGVLVKIRAINKGTAPVDVKLFYYCDFDISGTFGDDEASLVLDPETDRLAAIEQIDAPPADPAKPLWFGGCPNYKSFEIDTFSTLRDKLDLGVNQLDNLDHTIPGAGDHTCALSSDKSFLEKGQSIEMQVAIGAPGISACMGDEPICPWDCIDGDGVVGILDFLGLLAQWGQSGTSCDFGEPGVGILDFLKLLANWGACPTFVPAGIDCWETECGATKASFCNFPIPPDFFEPGSQPFFGEVPLQGVPDNQPDTIVQRLSDMAFDDVPAEQTIDIQIIQLDLVGCQPIVVECQGGPCQWNVQVTLSPKHPSPPGQMTVRREHPNGGTFESVLPVQPVFIFSRVENPADIRILDTGQQGFPPDILVGTRPSPWVHNAAGPFGGCGENFVPGIEEPVPGDPASQCCRPVCHSGATADHCVVVDVDCSSCPGGACCLPDGTCLIVQIPTDCTGTLAGEYKGDGTTCEDNDGDGIPDVQESNDCCAFPTPCNTGTSPVNPDTDGDGLLDGEDPSPCGSVVPQ